MADGKLSIHRVKRSASDDPSRAIQTLQMELQQIMKGRCPLQVCVRQSQGAGVLGGAWTAVSKGVSDYIQALGSPAGSDQSMNCPPFYNSGKYFYTPGIISSLGGSPEVMGQL